jgi:hypothetical protein
MEITDFPEDDGSRFLRTPSKDLLGIDYHFSEEKSLYKDSIPKCEDKASALKNNRIGHQQEPR